MRLSEIRHKRNWTALLSLTGASLIETGIVVLLQPAGQLLQDPADGASV